MKPAATPTDIAPSLAGAHRSLILAMMGKVAQCGFRDMTPAFASLMPLLDAKGARPTVLAQRAGITKQAVGQLARELKARGYVEQVADPTDTRAILVRLTRRGVALREACATMRQEIHRTARKALGPRRLQRLQRDLEALATALTYPSETTTRRDPLASRAVGAGGPSRAVPATRLK